MVFNWFRRQFNEEEKVEQPPAEPSQAAPSSDSQGSEPQEDYLAWAKAAYQNIQQRQQSEVTAPAASEQASPAPESTSPADTLPASEITIAAEETISEQVHPGEIESPEAIANAPAGEGVAEAETRQSDIDIAQAAIAGSPSIALESAPAEAIPIWARANAERQARLEQLKTTAIESPESIALPAQAIVSAPASPSPPPSAPEAPSFETPSFDEGFLWSAEVLAAQGRRPEEVSAEEITWLQKLRRGLGKTRLGLVNQLKAVVGQGPLNQEAITEIEALLLQADVGVEATDRVIEALQQKMRSEILPPDAAIAYLKEILRNILDEPLRHQKTSAFVPNKERLNIWLMTGVNGAGKTTTIGKLAHVAGESGYTCLVAAADTFRAAAVEQVKIWAARSGVEVIANPGQNTDPAAVVFDAITAAQTRHIELLLVDTAGRLQNKKNLMDELSKVRRIIDKKAPDAQVEALLVLDATLGQNGLRQAQVFSEAAKLTGVVLTKLDGSAKGGVALAIVQQLGLPIRFIGAGEGIRDLRPFSSYEFVEALLSN